MIMEVNNGIIINGVLHEFVIPSESPCLECRIAADQAAKLAKMGEE